MIYSKPEVCRNEEFSEIHSEEERPKETLESSKNGLSKMTFNYFCHCQDSIGIAAEDSQDTTVRQSCINLQVLTYLQWDCTQAKIRTAAFFCSMLYKRFCRYLRKQPSLQTTKTKSWLCSLVLVFSRIISFRSWMSRKVSLDRDFCKQVCNSESRIHIGLMFTHRAGSLQQQPWQGTIINEKRRYNNLTVTTTSI